MDWRNPVAKRTRQSEALYYKELHKRIKLERSGGGGGGGGNFGGQFESGSESQGSVVGGLFKEGSGSVRGRGDVGRKRRNVGKRKGKVETISVSDDEVVEVDQVRVSLEEDSVLIVGTEGSGDAVELAGDCGNMETSSVKVESGLRVEEGVVLINEDDVSEEDALELTGDDGNIENSSIRNVSGLKAEKDVVVISEDVVSEEEGDGVCLMAKAKSEEDEDVVAPVSSDENEDEEPADDVDSGGLSDSDYEVNESSEEVEYDGSDDADGWDFLEKPQSKIDSSDVPQHSGVWGDEDQGTTDGDAQENYSTTKKDIKVKHNSNNIWVGTSENNFVEYNPTFESYSKSRGESLSQPFGVEDEDENDEDLVPKQISKSRKIGISTIQKQNRAQKCSRVLKDLLDSMLNDSEGALEELASQQSTVPSNTKEPLPLKFTFGVQMRSPPQKSEFEKELDVLWDEFDRSLTASEDALASFNKVNQTADSKSTQGTDNMPQCHNGLHKFVIDEEIGIKCKYCSLVKLEIRHSMPSFSKYPYGRSEKKSKQNEDDYVGFDEIPFEDVCNSQPDTGKRCYAEGTVWDLIPNIRKGMHPHQQEGFEFIWKNIAGGIYLSELPKKICTDSGNGCIISHAPGTGKSRLTIAFLQTYMKLYPACRPVIIAPCSMLLTWEAEFRKWKVGIPFYNLIVPVLSGNENAAAINLLGRANNDVNSMRLLKLYSWKKDGGILGLSYNLYERLAGENGVEKKCSGRNKSFPYHQEFQEMLLKTPNLLVLDEGHTPRNERSLIWKALCKIQTEKRIILSGTPFQNNFEELFNTLCLVRPKFADSIQSDCHGMQRRRMWKVSAAKANWLNLTSPIGKLEEGRVSEYKLEELRYMLDSFVHIYKGNILQKSLPGLRDSVIVLRHGEFQKRILEGVCHVHQKNLLKRNHLASLISLHPSLLPESERVHFPRDQYKFEGFRFNPEVGVKTKFLMELIRLSEITKEKVLVFSEYIDPLNFIREMLKSCFRWTEGREILFMDGQRDMRQRQSSINTFNDLSSEARVLLASMRACCEGINLVGASRVVLLDVVWNPSVERQAISRAYRLGQKRVVHVYQLISGKLEWDKYCLQTKKSLLSELVFSSTDKEDNDNVISKGVCGDSILEEMVQQSSFKDMLEKIIHQPKESSFIETFNVVDEECT